MGKSYFAADVESLLLKMKIIQEIYDNMPEVSKKDALEYIVVAK